MYCIQNIVFAVENENHCDFVKLREMLIRTNMEDMRENTHSKHYELFRRNKLQEMGFSENESKRLVTTTKKLDQKLYIVCIRLTREYNVGVYRNWLMFLYQKYKIHKVKYHFSC